MEMLNQKQKIIAGVIIIIVIAVIGYYYINSTKDIYSNTQEENIIEEEEQSIEVKDKTIKVHITGAVKSNGIVEVDEGARIADVIEKAGGITDDADLSNVNLAYIIADGQKIYIPSIDDKTEEPSKNEILSTDAGIGIIEDNQENSTIININKANVIQLMALPGIGESTAAKIIEYRKVNGNFKNIEEIKNVPGIGNAKFNTIKEFISV